MQPPIPQGEGKGEAFSVLEGPLKQDFEEPGLNLSPMSQSPFILSFFLGKEGRPCGALRMPRFCLEEQIRKGRGRLSGHPQSPDVWKSSL